MLADSPAVVPVEDARDLIRRVVGTCADVHEANPQTLRHDGPSGQRFKCPRHSDDGYRRAELLKNGDLLLHCEGRRLHRSDLGYAEELAGLLP